MTLACSGKLHPKDSRTVSVSVLEGATTPVDFCGGGLGGSWTDYCNLVVEEGP